MEEENKEKEEESSIKEEEHKKETEGSNITYSIGEEGEEVQIKEAEIQVKESEEQKEKPIDKVQNLGLKVPKYQPVFDEDEVFGEEGESEKRKAIEEGKELSLERGEPHENPEVVLKNIINLEHEFDKKEEREEVKQILDRLHEKGVSRRIIVSRIKKAKAHAHKKKSPKPHKHHVFTELNKIESELEDLKSKKEVWD